MLSDNIKYYRKKSNLSQEELAEKLGVSRQSVSFWETGQTQPTLDNIIALSRIFNISSDILLGNVNNTEPSQQEIYGNFQKKKKNKTGIIIASTVICIILIASVLLIIFNKNNGYDDESTDGVSRESVTDTVSEGTSETVTNENTSDTASDTTESITIESTSGVTGTDITDEPFDLFLCCKNFAIEKGNLNGDYCIYQQPSAKYGGYENEYFSIAYWADSNRVEFCLHCPLNETTSHNFYITMRGGYNKKYEHSSSKYYRETGISFRFAKGYIDPAVFSENYPISCDIYEGSTDGQNDFMEQTRIGICDLIKLIKNFVETENMDCDFSDFDFVNFK